MNNYSVFFDTKKYVLSLIISECVCQSVGAYSIVKG